MEVLDWYTTHVTTLSVDTVGENACPTMQLPTCRSLALYYCADRWTEWMLKYQATVLCSLSLIHTPLFSYTIPTFQHLHTLEIDDQHRLETWPCVPVLTSLTIVLTAADDTHVIHRWPTTLRELSFRSTAVPCLIIRQVARKFADWIPFLPHVLIVYSYFGNSYPRYHYCHTHHVLT